MQESGSQANFGLGGDFWNAEQGDQYEGEDSNDNNAVSLAASGCLPDGHTKAITASHGTFAPAILVPLSTGYHETRQHKDAIYNDYQINDKLNQYKKSPQ